MKSIIGRKVASSDPAVTTVCIDDNSAGQRVDNFLIRHFKGVPKTHIYRMIRVGEVRLNKGRIAANTRLEQGDLLRLPPVRVSDPEQTVTHPTMRSTMRHLPVRDFFVVFEDECLLVIDKPATVAVHGGSGVSFGVIEQLRMARPTANFLELVHRLDRDTSGLLLIAKKRSALTHLQHQFRERQTSKTYLAMVAGQWPARLKVLDKPLYKYVQGADEAHIGERRVRVVARDDPNGMASVTLVKVLASSKDVSLLEVTLKTGRTHQIRVHLASEGYPIVGDDKYGNFELNKTLANASANANSSLKRLFLHAWQLQFNHPVSGERLVLTANLPPELSRFSQHYFPTPFQHSSNTI